MKVVGVTACPSGVAHTYMAAEALSLAGKKAGVEVKVETQGSTFTSTPAFFPARLRKQESK